MLEYHEAHVLSRQAEKAWRAVDERKSKAIRDAEIWVPYSGFGNVCAQVGSHYRCVDISTARHQLTKDFEEAVAAAPAGKERARVKRRYAVLRRKLDAGAERVAAIRVETGLEAALAREVDARHRAWRAKDALMAFKPTTIEEVAAIVRCLYVTARDSESFYSYPAAQVAIMLNPDLGVAS